MVAPFYLNNKQTLFLFLIYYFWPRDFTLRAFIFTELGVVLNWVKRNFFPMTTGTTCINGAFVSKSYLSRLIALVVVSFETLPRAEKLCLFDGEKLGPTSFTMFFYHLFATYVAEWLYSFRTPRCKAFNALMFCSMFCTWIFASW